MPSDEYISRPEFQMLVGQVDGLGKRLDNIDSSGTRGVLAVQERLTDAIKDIQDVRLELNTIKSETASRFDTLTKDTADRFDHLAESREKERLERRSERHWLIGAAITGLAGLGGLYAFLVEIAHHVHLAGTMIRLRKRTRVRQEFTPVDLNWFGGECPYHAHLAFTSRKPGRIGTMTFPMPTQYWN